MERNFSWKEIKYPVNSNENEKKADITFSDTDILKRGAGRNAASYRKDEQQNDELL